MDTPEPRQLTSEEAWKITCHEAGHAVVAVRHQLPIEYAERGDGESGKVELSLTLFDDEDRDWSWEEIAQYQQFYAGGAAAEWLLFGTYREYACGRDRAIHRAVEERWHPCRAGGWDEDVRSAMKVLDRESVEKVARALERHSRLDDEHLYELLGCKAPWDCP